MKQRDLSLDLLRIVACVMVVIMHSPIPSENANGLLLSSLVEHINSQLLQIAVVSVLTLTLSFFVSLIFGITPFGNAVVGWRKK